MATGKAGTGQPPVQSNRAGGWGNHCRKRVLSTGTRRYLKGPGNRKTGQQPVQSNRAGGWGNHSQTRVHANIKKDLGTGKLANHLCSQIRQVAGEIIVGYLRTKHRCTQISKGNWEWGNWPTTCAVKSVRRHGKSLSNTSVLNTGTQNYLKATGNAKTGQPPMLSNRAGGWGNHCGTTDYVLSTGTQNYLKATRNAKTGQPHMQSNQACGWGNNCRTRVSSTGTCKYLKRPGIWETGQPSVQSNRAGGWEIIVVCLRTKHKCTQISKGNWEWGNWPTTCAVKLGRCQGKSLLKTCVLSTNTRKYLQATRNRENGQPLFKSNRAGGCGNQGGTTDCVLCTGTRNYLKATGNAATGQPLVQSNWAGGWGNHYGTTTCVLSTGTRNYLKATGNAATGQPPVQSNRASG
ncbi:hypothetical protein L3X38_036701 [Prunus dulcis]|uniref:Uncharacterized protein n=1 Tax=Prunus dulcis TaxID=3755 RepID=A0AAD4V1Z8_PRUDU|nr:hypothetical protein L3X38_036701 [Prunus dulcis]